METMPMFEMHDDRQIIDKTLIELCENAIATLYENQNRS
jgi:hypothetical protein